MAECCMHLKQFSVSNTNLTSFKAVSWEKFVDCAKRWSKLTCPEGDLSRKFLEKLEIVKNNDGSFPFQPSAQFQFHRSCYQHFTNTRILLRAEKREKRKEKQDDDLRQVSEAAMVSQNSSTQEKPLLRSGMNRFKTNPVNPHVLPKVCVICNSTPTKTCKVTGKRTPVHLVRCATYEAGNKLKIAARLRGDDALTTRLQGGDCIAIETHYHNTCYKKYLHKPNSSKFSKEKHERCIVPPYAKAFNVFCKRYVEEGIIEDKEVYRMSKLVKKFIDTVEEVEGVSVEYRAARLKKRIKGAYPQIVFFKPNRRNQSEIVYAVELSAEDVLDGIPLSSDDSTSSDESSEGDLSRPLRPSFTPVINSLYHAALTLKEVISTDVQVNAWPPHAEHLTVVDAEHVVPKLLFNFLAWTVGASIDVSTDCLVNVQHNIKLKILSVAQDIIFIGARGRKLMPKHSALAMTVRHFTGSAKLIGILNGLGHCVSHSAVLEHDTALAEQQIDRGDAWIPNGIREGVFTTVVFDNNDFGEETLSGKGTTHNTNGIIIQRNLDVSNTAPLHPLHKQAKNRHRSVPIPLTQLATFHGGKRKGPHPFGTNVPLNFELDSQEFSRNLDMAYYLTKLQPQSSGTDLPGWTGFNMSISNHVPSLSTLRYLPVIDASPTDMATVATILKRSLEIADKLKLQCIVLVLDQAIYCKAQQLRWTSATYMQRIVIRLGAFHTTGTMLACIGKRFSDSGLEDIMIESDLVATRSISGIKNGHHYNRSVRAHKIVSEALQRLRLESYINSIKEEERVELRKLISDLQHSYPSLTFYDILHSHAFSNFNISYKQFIDKNSSNPTFAFWSSYIAMVDNVLLFIRASREGNWHLHLSAIRSMLPWMFAYNRVNYSRYLPSYWLEMMTLKDSHPDINAYLNDGNFVVQRQQQYGFAQIPCDQAIEQTCNRDSKTKGGIIGFTRNKGAVHRWILTTPCRAGIQYECERMAGKDICARSRKDLDSSRIQKDETDVKNVMQTINNMMNPFQICSSNDLFKISSGTVCTEIIKTNLLGAEKQGDAAFLNFCNQRLKSNTIDFHHRISNLKLKTFSDMRVKVKTRLKNKEIVLKSDRDLFARLLVIGQNRNVDLKDMLRYSLNALPLSLANPDGSLRKTNKAKLMHYLEDTVGESVIMQQIPYGCTWIVDAMATIQMMVKVPPTFGMLAEVLLLKLVSLAQSTGSKTIHFVADQYPVLSIKGEERKRRTGNGAEIVHIYSGQQQVPHQWKQFLSVGKNKEALLSFLFKEWSSIKPTLLGNVILIFGHGGDCHKICANPDKTAIDVSVVIDLKCNHEEADTRLLLHCKYAAQSSSSVVIKSPDTDVFILTVSCFDEFSEECHIYFNTGKGSSLRTIDIGKIFNHVGSKYAKAIVGLHSITGCDSVSAFATKGKLEPAKKMMNNEEMMDVFQTVGQSFNVAPDLYKRIEKQICKLYKQNCQEVNLARFNLFKLSGRPNEESMPPNQDALYKHIDRANYQAAIWRRCLQQYPEIPSAENFGWKIEDSYLVIDWSSLKSAPDSVLELVNCGCSTGCDTDRFSCRKYKLSCTDLCKCVNCENEYDQEDDDDEEDEEEDEDIAGEF